MMPHRFFVGLACFTALSLRAQDWLPMLQDPTVNYFPVEQAYLAWRGPIAADLDARQLALNDPERRFLRDADRRFKHWARQYGSTIGSDGRPLDRTELKLRTHGFHGTARQRSAQQGEWTSFGPTEAPGSWGMGVVSCFAAGTSDPDRLFVGTWSSGIWRSDDEGNSWSPVLDSLARFTVRDIAVDPFDEEKVLAISHLTLLRSTDGGAQWTEVDPGLSESITADSKITFHPEASDTVWISGSGGMIRSTDGGSTWSSWNDQDVRDMELKPGDPHIMYAYRPGPGGGFHTLLRSTDQGLGFDSIAYFVGNNTNAIAGIAVTQADPERLYVFLPGPGASGTPPGQVARSLDGGGTFELMPTSNLLRGFYYPNPITVSDADPDVILAGDIFLRRSTDGGVTWTACHSSEFADSSYMHVDHRDVVFQDGKFWSCNDGGIYATTDDGATWEDRSNNMAIGHVTDHDRSLVDTIGVVMGQDHNGCQNFQNDQWWEFVGGDGYNVAVDPEDPLHILGTNQYGHVRVSFDGGGTSVLGTGITESGYGFRPDKPWAFNRQRPNTVYSLRDNVFRSFDRGLTWSGLTAFSGQDGGGILVVHPADSNVMYTAYWRTTDNGTSWTPIGNPEGTDLAFGAITVDENDPGRVWACTLFGPLRVYYSNDTGATWSLVPSYDLPNTTSRSLVHLGNGVDALYLATDAGVYFRDVQVSNWQPFSAQLPYCTLYDIQHHPLDDKLSLSVYGRGIWMADPFDHAQAPVADLLAEDTLICPGGSVTFHDNSLNNGPGYDPQYLWIFTGGLPSTSTDPDPVVTYPDPGVFGASLAISNANGTDTVAYSALITVEEPIVQMPLNEGFEDAQFPPAGWTSVDANGSNPWTHVQYDPFIYGGYGQSASSTQYWTAPHGSALDALISPSVILESPQGWVLIYDRAYRCHTDPVRWDTLRVFYTTDCDVTRQPLFSLGCNELGSVPPGLNSVFPDSSSWSTDTVAIGTVPAFEPVRFGFEFPTAGNRTFYLDNVRLEYLQPMDIADHLSNALSVAPNPAATHLRVRALGIMRGSLVVLDADGRLVIRQPVSGDDAEFDLRGLGNGLYLVRLEGTRSMARFVVAR